MQYIKYIAFLSFTIVGNPFYQMISYLICKELNFGASKGTNIYQIDLFAFLITLVLIFIARLSIYSFIFYSQQFSFYKKGNNSFLYIFVERHLFQVIGIFTFLIWIYPLEGNIIGFFVFPLTLLLGTILSIITFTRLLKTKKVMITRNKYP